MNAATLTQNPVFIVLQEALAAAAREVRDGMDVAPAQLARLEGLAAALIAAGSDRDSLARACGIAGGDAIAVIADGDLLRFDCRQRRAPVYPSTRA